MKKRPLSVTLSELQYQEAYQISLTDNRSLSYVVGEAIEAYAKKKTWGGVSAEDWAKDYLNRAEKEPKQDDPAQGRAGA